MAVLVSNFSCPTEQLSELAKRHQEIMPKFPQPDYATMRGPYVYSDIEKGIKGLAITEIESSKILQERLRLAAFYNAFNGIQGFKWSIELWLEQADIQERIKNYGF